MKYYGTEYGGRYFDFKLIDDEYTLISAGCGCDISFELETAKFWHRIILLDPVYRSIFYVLSKNLPINILFLPYAIGIRSGKIKMFAPKNDNYVSFSATNLQNTKVYRYFNSVSFEKLIDFFHLNLQKTALKLDIEGLEYRFIDKMMKQSLLPDILMIELHNEEKNKSLLRKLKKYYNIKYINNNDYLMKLK